MRWTWDKTDAVLRWGVVSGMVAAVLSAVTGVCSCYLFLVLWVTATTTYCVSAFLQVSPKGRAVLVTGCDSGFGFALALHLNQLGFRVFAGCLLADEKGHGAEQLRKKNSDRLHVLQLDVTSQKQTQEAVKAVKKLLGEGEVLWGLVNNAGLSMFGEVEWVPLEAVRRLLEVNVVGLLGVTKAFLPLLRKARGRVVTIASGLSRMAAPSRSTYVLSKYAVQGLNDCLRYEMRRWGVKVCVIEPGNFTSVTSILTKERVQKLGDEMWASMSEEVRRDYGRREFDERIKQLKSYSDSDKGDTDPVPVLWAFTEGLMQRFPQTRYLPMNLYYRTRIYIATFLPEFFYEYIYIY